MNCPECGALNYVNNDPNDPYTHECTVCGALMPMQFKGHNRWDFGVPYEELSQQEKSELHERGRKYDEEQRKKQAYEPPMPVYEPQQQSYTSPFSSFPMPMSSDQQIWDDENDVEDTDELEEDEEEYDEEEEEYIETPPAFVFTPSAPAYTPTCQEPDRHQPEGGKWRLGRDIQTGAYLDAPQHSRRQGLYILGLQGFGKTGLLENLVIQDIKQHIGVCVLDAKGELIDHVLARLLNREKEEKVILLDINDADSFPGLNLFACADPTSDREIQYALNQVLHVFEKAFGVSQPTTPRIYDYLYNCAYALIANPGYTMMDIRLLLTSASFRSTLLGNVTDAEVLDFWNYYNLLPERQQREESREILRRLNDLTHDPLRYVVGQPQSTISLQQIMDTGKILLVKLNSKRFEKATNLIGSIIVALILNACDARTTRKQFNLYADEFQRFATEDFATLIEEARSAGIGITMAHQNRGQLELSEKQADANLKQRTLSVGNLVVFRAPTDADSLAGLFAQKPEEAREQVLEKESVEVKKPQQHRRVEEQITEYVEDDIEEITQNPVRFLVGARASHQSARVGRATQAILIPLTQAVDRISRDVPEAGQINYQSPFVRQRVFYPDMTSVFQGPMPSEGSLTLGENHINRLLVEVMEGNIGLNSRAFFEEIEDIVVTLAGFIGWFGFTVTWSIDPYRHGDGTLRDVPVYIPHERREPIRGTNDVRLDEPSRQALSAFISNQSYRQSFANKLFETLYSEGGEKYATSERQQKSKDAIKSLTEEAVNSLVSFISHLKALCEELAKEPIRVPTGQKRMVPRTRTQVNWLTDESEKIQHPRVSIVHHPTEQEMTNRMVRELINLPLYTARVKITTDAGIEEHAIETIEPEKGIRGDALQKRINSIKERNIQDGYLGKRTEVEAEIRQRRKQYSESPEEEPPDEPPISRRPPK